ncbi:hypothetical protein D9M69_625330 [compost metagenome]
MDSDRAAFSEVMRSLVWALSRLDAMVALKLGAARAIRMAATAMVTINSIKVKPEDVLMLKMPSRKVKRIKRR